MVFQTQPSVIIFDWDGTLSDSISQIVRSLLHAAETHQQPLRAEAAKNIIGLGLPEAMHILFPQVPELHAAIQASYSAHFLARSHEIEWYQGAETLLSALHQAGRQTAIATGKSRKGLDRVMQHLGCAELFHATRCASETRSKPHPMMLEEIVQELGVSVADCVMVGDTSYDLDMARAIGMSAIGISHGVHPPEILAACEPRAIVDSLSELQSLLLSGQVFF